MAQDPNVNHWGAPYEFVQNGVVVVMQHASGKHLRIDPRDHKICDANGGTGQFARWEAHKNQHGHVQFKNVKSGRYLRIHNDKIDADGGGGPWTWFVLHRQSTGVYKLESSKVKGKYVSINKHGVNVGEDGPKEGTWCRLRVFRDGPSPPFSHVYAFGMKKAVIIEHRHGGGHLKVGLNKDDDKVYGNGGRGEFAQFEVEPIDGGKVIKLKSIKHGGYLRIYQAPHQHPHPPHHPPHHHHHPPPQAPPPKKVDCKGVGGPFTRFKVHQAQAVNQVRLESEKFAGDFIAVHEKDGQVVIGKGLKDCLLTFYSNN